MNKVELEALLEELDVALVKAFPGPELLSGLVVGGACLLFQDVTSRPTEDVDMKPIAVSVTVDPGNPVPNRCLNPADSPALSQVLLNLGEQRRNQWQQMPDANVDPC